MALYGLPKELHMANERVRIKENHRKQIAHVLGPRTCLILQPEMSKCIRSMIWGHYWKSREYNWSLDLPIGPVQEIIIRS